MATSSKEISRRLNIYINVNEADAEVARLNARAAKLTTEIKRLELAGKDASKEIAKLGQVNENIDRLKKKISGELSPSFNDLSSAVQRTWRELKTMSEQDTGFAAKKKQYDEATAALQKHTSVLKGVQASFRSFAGDVKSIAFGVLVGGTVQSAVQAIAGYFTGIISGNAKVSDSLADIRKTTGLTVEEVKDLNAELSKINTRTARQELRDIAVVAGQLGLAKNDILDFVKSTDVLAVALGDEFKGGAAEVADVIGRLRNVLSDTKTDNVAQDMLRLGNALNVIAQEGAATAPVVADFANRIGGVGITLGLTTGEVLGLSATLQELNVNTERGGTAVTRILQTMARESEKFAAIAGVSAKEFKDIVNTDLLGAFQLVVEGSAKSGDSATALSGILDELGVDGAGASEVFAKLGSNMDLLNGKINTASNSLLFTASVTEEFDIKNNTLAATLEKLEKSFNGLVTSSGFADFVKKGVSLTADFVNALKQLPDVISRYAAAIFLAIGAIAAYNAAAIKARISAALLTLEHIRQQVVQRASLILDNLRTAAILTQVTATQLLTRQITLGTAATRAWSLATSLLGGALGVVGLAIAGAVAAIKIYSDNSKEAMALERTKAEITRDVSNAVENATFNQQDLNNQLKRFNELSVEQKQNLLEQIRLSKEDAKAELLRAEAKLEVAKAQANQATPFQKFVNFFKSAGNQALMFDENMQDAGENVKDVIDAQSEGLEKLRQKIEEFGNVETQVADNVEAFDKAMKVNTDTVEGLEEKQRLLNTAMRNAKRDSDQYKAAQSELLKVQAELKKANGGTADPGKPDPNREKRLNEAKSFLAQMQQMRHDMELALLGDDEREIQIQKEKYAKLQADLSKFHDESLVSEEQFLLDQEFLANKYADELAKLQDKQFATRSDKEYQASLNTLQSYFEDRKDLYAIEYANGVISQEDYNDKIDTLDLQFLQGKVNVANDYKTTSKTAEADVLTFTADAALKKIEIDEKLAERRKALAQKTQDELQKIYSDDGESLSTRLAAFDTFAERTLAAFKGTEEEKTKLAKLFAKERGEIIGDEVQEWIDGIAAIAQQSLQIKTSIDTLIGNQETKELQRDKSANDQKKKNLEEQLRNKQISQEQYNQRVAQLDEQYNRKAANLKRKQFERQKAASIIEAIIHTATAVAEALPNIPLSVIAGVAGAAQVAAIASQPVPEFAKGTASYSLRKNSGAYLTEGVSHTAGGMPIINPLTGKKVAEIEVGEMILSKATVRNNPEATAMLVRASTKENGRHVPELKPRTISQTLPALQKPTYTVNYSRNQDNMRWYANGGMFGTSNTPDAGVANDPKIISNKHKDVDPLAEPTLTPKIISNLEEILRQLIVLNGKDLGLHWQTFKKFSDQMEATQNKSFGK